MTQPLRVLVGDDDFLVREGVVRALEEDPRVEVVGAEGDADALAEAVERLAPDVVVTDIRMPPTKTDDGIRFAIELGRTHPDIGVVVLSEHAQVTYATALFADGGGRRAYLLKDRVADREMLIGAIEAVAQGTPLLDPTIVSLVISGGNRATGIDRLTARERQVLGLLAQGRSNTAIATELVLTRRAVERHINAIFTKLDLAESDSVNRRVLAALVYARAQIPQ